MTADVDPESADRASPGTNDRALDNPAPTRRQWRPAMIEPQPPAAVSTRPQATGGSERAGCASISAIDHLTAPSPLLFA